MPDGLRVPYTQQFSPEQTPLQKLLPILRQHEGNCAKLRGALASAFFKHTKTPDKIAGNTLISLKTHGIIDDDCRLTDFGRDFIGLQDDANAAAKALARRILFDHNGILVVETLREMKQARIPISLNSLARELSKRGFRVSRNSSDLSGLLSWLRGAGLLTDYEVADTAYQELTGSHPTTIFALKGLDRNQVLFLRAMVSLGVSDWTPYEKVARHAEGLYPGEVAFNWKDIPKTVLRGLADRGLIEVRKKEKAAKGARGGKPADVKPTPKFLTEVAEPILKTIYGGVGFEKVREISSKPWQGILSEIADQDPNVKAKALELLAIRIGQLLDLEFMGLRETDEDITGGAEIDGMLHSARLIYSRWQIQCKASAAISVSTLAKEVGLVGMTLANVILVVGTGSLTPKARRFKDRTVQTTNLNIIVLEGKDLKRIAVEPEAITQILSAQARDALRAKGTPEGIRPLSGSQGGTEPKGNGKQAAPQGPSEAKKPQTAPNGFRRAYHTDFGCMYLGDSLQVLPHLIDSGVRAKLIVTSPPFALVRKKEYGNEDAANYVDWFCKFVPLFEAILEPEGSLVIDIGGSWVKGLPVKSTYHLQLVLRILKLGFYLAQDFYHYNPARLPTPAEWVTVRRMRLKDAVNTVWWFVRDPMAPADNRRVLLPYSPSMRVLLERGYKAKLRPSGHDISKKFQRDHGGSIAPNMIPANVLSLANTESNSHYLVKCRAHGIKPHPARFPHQLPEFFIKLLTDPGDLVIDPFAGSNVTGEAAERLGRRWIGIELTEEYVVGSRFRFMKDESPEKSDIVEEPRSAHRQTWLPLVST